MKNQAAQALRAIPSEKRSEQSRINGRKNEGGRRVKKERILLPFSEQVLAQIGGSSKYNTIHQWLRRNCKRDKKCNHCGKQKKTQFAKRHGFEHAKNTANYLCLCAKCHKKYDRDGRLALQIPTSGV